jgi:hypothetical protein
MPKDDEMIFAVEDEDSENDPRRLLLDDKEVYTTPSDPDVKTLLGRIEDGSLILRPKFQRASVWDDGRKSRLIESLLLNIPIPPCFLGEDEDGTRVVVDGQQRLIAIDDFYHGRYALKGLEVLADLNGKVWRDMPSKYERKILQRVIRTLVISHHTQSEIRFLIFERLNTGAIPLTDQEIRNATLSGSLNVLLNDIANSTPFLDGMRILAPDVRLRHHELVLRFFSIDSVLHDYRPPLKLILTNFMKTNRNARQTEVAELDTRFMNALTACRTVFGDNIFRRYRVKEDDSEGYERVVSKALFDLQMITLNGIPLPDLERRRGAIEDAFKSLVRTDRQFAEALSRATDHRSRFYLRVRRWIAVLDGVGLHSPAADRLPTEEH